MRTIAQTAFLMAILTFISKCFGFLREMIMANYYGASYVTDAYVMAYTIMTVLFGGVITAVSTAYIPLYSKITEKKGKVEGDVYTSKIINLLLLITIMISLIGILFSNQIISIFASGFNGETAKLASSYVKVLFSFVIFSSTASILDSYLQYKGTFLSQIISGYYVSIFTIATIIISYFTSYYFLAFGMVIGYIFRFGTMLIIAKKRGYKHTVALGFDENTKEIIALAIPTFIGSCMININQFVDKTLASGLVEGSISALNYAFLLNNMIMNVTISVLSTIIYPKITKANSLGQYDAFNNMVSKGINIMIMIALPFSMGSMLYSNQIIQIVYERGAFDPTATAMTGSAFFYYSIGLVFLSVNILLTKVFYSMHDMKTPMIFAGIGVIINIVLNLILVRPMAHNGLALATSIASICNIIMFLAVMHKKYPHIKVLGSKRTLAKITAASIISVGASYIIYALIINELSHVIIARLFQLAIPVIFAMLIYLLTLIILKIDEVKILLQIIRVRKK